MSWLAGTTVVRWPPPGRAAAFFERVDLALHRLLLCAECFTGHRLPGLPPHQYAASRRQ